MSALNTASAGIEAAAAAGVVVQEEVPSTSTSLRRQRRRRRRRRQRPSVVASSGTTTDGSFRFSDSEEDNRLGGSYDECSFSTETTEGISVVSDSRRHSSRRGSCTFSDDEDEEEEMVDLESGELELKVHKNNREKKRECRICHLSLSVIGRGNGVDHSIIELGCCCKGDLGSAHKQCAETWFKIKGNTTCEICGSSAVNIAGEQANEANNSASSAPAASTAPLVFNETRNFWHGRRVMNLLLACMILAFIISWLFHFKIRP